MKKIIVLEDERDIAEALAAIIQDAIDCEVLQLYHPREALLRIPSYKPDLISTDIILPDISGLDFIKYVRQNQSKAELPIMVVSIVELSDLIEKQQNLEQMINGYYRKPFLANHITEGVGQILRRRTN